MWSDSMTSDIKGKIINKQCKDCKNLIQWCVCPKSNALLDSLVTTAISIGASIP